MEFISVIKNLPLKTNAKILDINNSINIDSLGISEIFPDAKITTLSKDKLKTKNIISSLEEKFSHNDRFKVIHFNYDHGNKLPFLENSYDLIIINNVLNSLIYRESFLKECSFVLKDGGFVLLTQLHEDAHGVTTGPDSRTNLDDMLEYLDNAGITVVENFDTDKNVYGIIGVCSLV